MKIRRIILIFGLLNSFLYCSILPLWEGFDEAFHYSYVETLRLTGHLLTLGRTQVADDVSRSFELTPVSSVVHTQIPQAITYDQWFQLPTNEKEQRLIQLKLLRPATAGANGINYEAQQPPLAYLILAVVDWPISGAPITVRILVLRLFGAFCATTLLYFGATRLCRTLEVSEGISNAILFTMFCSQMLYATISHVANDWLAVGLSALFLSALAEFTKSGNRRSALMAGVWLTAGLLTKAYFLVFAVLALVLGLRLLWTRSAILVLAFAVPWYARNVLLYKSVSGTQEELGGVGWRQALAAAPHMNWIATARYLARSSLWTGNATFSTFSLTTVDFMLALLFVAIAAWSLRGNAIQSAERTLLKAIGFFSLGVAYASCASFAFTHGVSAGAEPWYAQVLLIPVLTLAFVGLSRWKPVGVVVAAAMVLTWAWVLIATWVVKLFPMYSGAGLAPMHLREVWNWYAHGAARHLDDFSMLAAAPASVVYAGLAISLTLSLLLSGLVVRGLAANLK